MGENGLERKDRLSELDPERTLGRIGLVSGSVFCDIGAGTGVFALPAAALTQARVYALEVSQDKLDGIAHRAAAEKLDGIMPLLIEDNVYPLESSIVDVALMCCVMHEIPEPGRTHALGEIMRILKPGGQFAVIEFNEVMGTFGPPAHERVPRADLIAYCERAGFTADRDFDLSEHFYCAVLTR